VLSARASELREPLQSDVQALHPPDDSGCFITHTDSGAACGAYTISGSRSFPTLLPRTRLPRLSCWLCVSIVNSVSVFAARDSVKEAAPAAFLEESGEAGQGDNPCQVALEKVV